MALTWSCALVTRRICRPTGDGTDLASVSSDPGSVLNQKAVIVTKFVFPILLCLESTWIFGLLKLSF